MVQTCINRKDLPSAIQYVEKSRAQKLVDLIAVPDLYPHGNIPESVKEFLELQYKINALRYENTSDDDTKSLTTANRDRPAYIRDSEEIQASIEQLEEKWNSIRKLDPETAASLKNSAPDLATIQQLITNSNTAILSFYTNEDDTYIFIIRQNSINYHATQTLKNHNLQNWIWDNWLTPYENSKKENGVNQAQWREQLPNFLHKLSIKLKLPELINQHLTDLKELILIPHRALHFIPLGSLPVNPDENATELKEVLLDKFIIKYIHSCQVLQFCQQRPPIETAIYGTAEDATDDLCASRLEGEYIAQKYNIPPENRLIGMNNATVENYQKLLKKVNVMLSTHHASYNMDNPLQSILLLGDNILTLSQILLSKYPHLDEVVLNNCESGMAKSTSISDDPLSLAFGFLRAGARRVVSTLWTVDDVVSAILSILYHEYKQDNKLPKSQALRLAQQEVRSMTRAKLLAKYPNFMNDYAKIIESAIAKNQKKMKEIRRSITQTTTEDQAKLIMKHKHQELVEATKQLKLRLNTYIIMINHTEPDQLLFDHPFYWSGFVYFGL